MVNKMLRLEENNSITRNGLITKLVTDDVFIFNKYKTACLSGKSIDGLGFVSEYSESVNTGDYTLPPNYTVLTVVFEIKE